MATTDATWAYRDAHGDGFARTYFRPIAERAISSIGLGTYLGDPTDEADDDYHEAITRALDTGINVLDTAINYRHQRSERVVGRALADSSVDREAVFVATKGGFVPFDGGRPADPAAYVQSEYVDTGIVDPSDLVRGHHCIAPAFIDDQLDRSLSNLDLETIDLYYVHNPEAQLAERSRDAVYDALEDAFTCLENRAAAGDIRHYGVATWDAFRCTPETDAYLSLPAVVERARAAAERAENAGTHFRAIQCPFNVGMADAFTVEAHESAAGPQSALWFAHEAGLDVFASATLLQGELTNAGDIPDAVASKLDGETPAQKAINFTRSAPGITSALVGMGSPDHVAENVAAGTFEPMGADTFDSVFE
jgi:aryl-alcohol dehydrogenase-like predicted oxidoreductase